jgi:hypothetical protein
VQSVVSRVVGPMRGEPGGVITDAMEDGRCRVRLKNADALYPRERESSVLVGDGEIGNSGLEARASSFVRSRR